MKKAAGEELKSYLPYKPNKGWAQTTKEFDNLDEFIFIESKVKKYILTISNSIKEINSLLKMLTFC